MLFSPDCNGLLALKRFAVSALVNSRMRFMRTYSDAVKCAILCTVTVIGTLLHCAADCLVIA